MEFGDPIDVGVVWNAERHKAVLLVNPDTTVYQAKRDLLRSVLAKVPIHYHAHHCITMSVTR